MDEHKNSLAIAHAKVAVADTAAGLAIRPDGTRGVGDACQARLVCAVGQLLLGALGTQVRACRIHDVRAVICAYCAGLSATYEWSNEIWFDHFLEVLHRTEQDL